MSDSESTTTPTPETSSSLATGFGEVPQNVSLWAHVRALTAKSATYQWRQRKANCCQLCTVVLVIVLMVLLQAFVDSLLDDMGDKSLDELLSPATRKPYLLRHLSKLNCDGVVGAPPAVLCDGDTMPAMCGLAQPVGVSNATLWVTAASGVSVGGPGEGGAGLLSNLPNQATVVHPAEARPRLFTTVCDEDDFEVYPLAFARYTELADVQAELFNAHGVIGLPPRYGGYVVRSGGVVGGASIDVDFDVHYNESMGGGRDVPRLSSYILASVMRTFTGGAVNVSMSGVRDFPKTSDSIELDIASLLAPFLYIYLFQLTPPVLLSAVVAEKEFRLLEIMKMMGLRMPAYWLVTYWFSFALYAASASLAWGMGALVGFRFFTDNSPALIFLLLFLFGHAMVALVFFFRVFLERTATASIVGYVYILSTGLLSSQVAHQYITDTGTPDAILWIMSLCPSLAFYRGIVALANGVTAGEPGLEWSDVNHDRVRMGEVYGFLFAAWAFFLTAAVYLDAVLASEYGVRRPFLFFLDAKTYGLSSWSRCCGGGDDDGGSGADRDEDGYVSTPIARRVEGEPDDVTAERQVLRNKGAYGLRAADISMVYPSVNGMPPKEACKSFSLGVPMGTVFGLLGANGAGKTTAISMMSGLREPTNGGTTHINGYDMRTETRMAHLSFGICPQHDLLWNDLTGEEHVRFYGRVKGLTGEALKAAVTEALVAVELSDADVLKKPSKAYSGGMKRRLSVACALVGDPAVVILDEPTTGLDPASKRALWRVLANYKGRAAMILTTHSMEEADVLCDRVGVFIDGQLKTIGSVADLKTRYTSGYKLSVTIDTERAREAAKFVAKIGGPGTTALNALSNVRNYEIPGTVAVDKLYRALATKSAKHGIIDFGLSNSSLEEVFLRVVELHSVDGAALVRAEREAAEAGVPLDSFGSSSSAEYYSDEYDE